MKQAKSGKGAVPSEIKKLADLVQQEIEDGSTTVEEIHNEIVSPPLEGRAAHKPAHQASHKKA
jgi:hypothetical protein